jgi:signal transduction histidine kinase
MPNVVTIALLLVAIPLAAGAWLVFRRGLRDRQKSQTNHDQESRLHFLEEYLPLPLVVFDGRGLIRRINPAAERLFGYPERELYGQTILRLLPKSPDVHGGEAEVRHRDGSLVPVRFTAARADTGGREIYLFFEKPVVTQTVTQPVIVQEVKPSLTVVEGVVNRIVHQFEGLLTTINGYTELAMHGLPHDSPILSDLKELASASDTASSLARNLLAFSGNQTIPTELVDLNVLVGVMEPAIRDAVNGFIRIERGTERAAVMANADCLRHVTLLLARSAHQRTARNGSILIASSRQNLPEAKPVYTGKLPAGEYGVLTVADTGPALGAATIEHLFEPLFLDADAVGVELAPIYGIVRSLGGWIDVTYEPENGNTFEVYFPYAGDIQVGSSARSRRAFVN